MNEDSCIEKPKQGRGVTRRRSAIYNLFILTLIVFSLVVMASVLIEQQGTIKDNSG